MFTDAFNVKFILLIIELSTEAQQMEAAITLNLPSRKQRQCNVLATSSDFNAKTIASQRPRYCYIVVKLLTEVAIKVADPLESLPQDLPYDTLRQGVINRQV